MKSIFKHSLTAMAVAGVMSANAATITSMSSESEYTGESYPLVSYEGLSIYSNALTLGSGENQVNVTLTAGADYEFGDELKVSVEGAVFYENADSFDPELGDNLALINATSTTLTFLVTGDVAEEDELTLEGATLLVTEAGMVSVSVSVLDAADEEFDTAAATTVAYIASEFSAEVSEELDATIDVDADRALFIEGSTTDTLEIDVEAGADVYAVSYDEASVSLSGSDLAFMLDSDGELDSDSYSVAAGSSDAEIDEDATAFSFTTTYGVDAEDDISLSLSANGEDAISAQDFGVEVTLGYTLGGTTGSLEAMELDAGSWELSGSTFNIPYMPYGSNISQVIYVSNASDIDGSIEVSAFDENGETYGPVTLDIVAEAGSVTKLATAVNAALAAEGYDGGTNKFSISIVVNAPSADLDLFSSYNAGGDRVTVPSSVVAND